MKYNYSAISIVLCVVMLLSACAMAEGENDITQAKVNQLPNSLNSGGNQSGVVSPVPPGLSTSFRTIEKLEAMISASELTDAALDAFLHEHSYDAVGQGIYNRDTLELFLQPFRFLGYPNIEDSEVVTSFGATFYPEEPRWHFGYRTGGVRYRFQYKIYDEKYDRSEQTPVGNYQIGEVNFSLYETISGDKSGLTGEIYFENFKIQVMVTEYDSIEDVKFEVFSWCKVE